MTRYLADSTAIWRMLRDPQIDSRWATDIDLGAVGSCAPQRVEFLRSARNRAEFDDMTAMFADLYPDVPVPKSVWSWIGAAQYRLAEQGTHQALSVVDWLICGVAASRDLVILHDDRDFATAARILGEFDEVRITAG